MKMLPCLALTAALVASVLVWNDRRSKDTDSDADFAKPLPEITQMYPFARDRLTRELIEGRRSLLATATLFGELNRLKPGSADYDRIAAAESSHSLPGRTHNERLCQTVERWVRAVLRNDPARKEVALGRLEAEFQTELREHGEIRLPDPASIEPIERILAETRSSRNQNAPYGFHPPSHGRPMFDCDRSPPITSPTSPRR
jgi:hypothetical protein